MAGPTLRAAAVVTLVVTALLGSAYALGRSLAPDPRQHHNAGATSSADDGPHVAPSPSPSRYHPTTPYRPGPTNPYRPAPTMPTADPDAAPPLDPDSEGPYGSRVSTGSTRVALTFDDGPDPQYTPQVLDLLRMYGVRATFCVVGQNAANHPDLIRAIVADGHTLCNHTWNHDIGLGGRSPKVIRRDLLRTSAAIRAAVPDARIAYFRQPGGAWTFPVVSTCEELGMTPLHWAVDPSDWQAPGPGRITATVLAQTAPGSIVLMHDGGGDRVGTVQALQRILPELLSRFQLEALPTGTT